MLMINRLQLNKPLMKDRDLTMKIKMFFTILLLLPSIAMAEVNIKNGNFFISYTDLLLKSAEHELYLQRTYNSKASGIGWHGFGWGTSFEARLLVMPDGSVVVREHGNGTDSHYVQKDNNKLQAGVDRIVAQAVKQNKLDAEAAKELGRKMIANEELRRANVLKYGIKTELPVGASVPSNECSNSSVTRIKDEYMRTSCERNYLGIMYTDYFDLKGRLIRKEKGDYKLKIHYAGKHPDKIEDSSGQKLFLKWTASGRIAEARTEDNKTVVRYYYDERDNLVMANTIGGYFYRYDYDDKHNMTRIGFIDNTHMDMQYDESSLVTSVTEPDGSKAVYAYRTDPKNPFSHYWTTTTKTSTKGETTSREDEFVLTADSTGVEQLASKTRTENDQKQDIVYDAQGRIKHVKKTTAGGATKSLQSIVYDDKGRIKLIKNDEDGGFEEFFYHPTLDKISRVVSNDKTTDFTYNKEGNLISASNANNQLIELSYDSNKRINRIMETDKSAKTQRELTFRYNDSGKPVNIKLIGKGEINVEYDNQGEITKVESEQGSEMAIEVNNAFQALLGVVKIGGVDLSM
jgi:YD repeat-containing protein